MLPEPYPSGACLVDLRVQSQLCMLPKQDFPCFAVVSGVWFSYPFDLILKLLTKTPRLQSWSIQCTPERIVYTLLV